MITMIKSIGFLATWIASIAVLAATIIFGMAQTTNWVDSVVLCAILTALALFGMTLSFIAKVEISESGIFAFRAFAIIAIILVLGAVQTFEVYGWKSNIDFLFGETTQASKTDKLKVEIAESKVKILSVGKVDINAAANELAAMDRVAAKCKHAWSWTCKSKSYAGKDAIEMKLAAQKESVEAMNDALTEIKSTEQNTGNYVHRAFKGMALVVDTEALKVQSYYRLTISALVVLLSHLGFVFYAGSDKKYVDIAKKVIEEFSHQSPTPQQPIFKPVQQHPEPIFNRMFVKPQQTASAEKPQTIKAGYVEDLADKMYDDTPRPKKGFIGFVDTNALPTNETGKNVLKPEKTDNATVPTKKTENIISKVVVIGDLGTHCQQCGVQFPKPRTGKRFCNNACRLISWKLENGK